MLPLALDWVAAHPTPVDPPRVGLLAAAFSHLDATATGSSGGSSGGGVTSKDQVAAALARGLGAHLAPRARRELAAELLKLLDGSSKMGAGSSGRGGGSSNDPFLQLTQLAEDPLAVLDVASATANGGFGGCGSSMGGGSSGSSGFVMTDSARELLSLVAPWLRDGAPFLLVRWHRSVDRAWVASSNCFAASPYKD